MQLDLLRLARLAGPIILEIANALFLAFRPNAHVKVDRLANSLLQRKAACAPALKLANVRAMRAVVASERIDLLDLVLANPQHSRANRRGKKFVQAGAKVIAAKIRNLE